MTNLVNTVFYIGVTNNLIRRVFEHKKKFVKGFTTRYNLVKLVYFEEFSSTQDALNREKQLKGGSRAKKIALIKSQNPQFEDLYERIIL